jgi:hypothetical protein
MMPFFSLQAIREASVIPLVEISSKTPSMAFLDPVVKPKPKANLIAEVPNGANGKNGINDIFGLPPCEVGRIGK